MGKLEKLLYRILLRQGDASIGFHDLCHLLKRLGFAERIQGDHHIFTHPEVTEILNLQPRDGHAKAYQVKQLRTILINYRLSLKE